MPQSKSRIWLQKLGTIGVATWNVGAMTGKGMELVDVMRGRRLDILCVQETKCKGNRSKELGEGYKML